VSSARVQKSWFRVGGVGAVTALLALALVNGCGETVSVGLDDALTGGGTATSGASAFISF